MTDYCSRADLYDFGVPRGAVPNPGRLVPSVDATSNALALDSHGFELNDPVMVRPDAGGSLPGGLAEGVTYYAVPLTENTFALAAASGGAVLDLTTSGENVLVLAPLPIASAISWASGIVEDMVPAHVLPLVAPFPRQVRHAAAELAAYKLASRTGAVSASLQKITEAAEARLARWATGVPNRGDGADGQSPANLAASASSSGADPDGWRTYGGT